MANIAHLANLTNAASEFVEVLQNTPELSAIPGFPEAQLVVIGGLAVSTQTQYRDTEDIDFAISPSTLGKPLKRALVQLYPNKFFFRADRFFLFRNSEVVQIDLVPEDIFTEYRPASFTSLAEINPSQFPQLSSIDLLISKVTCCTSSRTATSDRKDAKYAWHLAIQMPSSTIKRQ